MMDISTRDLFHEIMEKKEIPESRITVYRAISMDVIEEYEEECGKHFLEMNEEEIYELVFRVCSAENRDPVSFAPFVVSVFRDAFNYYSKHYHPVYNPIGNRYDRLGELIDAINQGRPRLTTDSMYATIGKLHQIYPVDQADHLELLILLFYDGVPSIDALLDTKVQDINYKKKSLMVFGREVNLSDRCFFLLDKFTKLDAAEGIRGCIHYIRWNGCVYPVARRENWNIDGLTKRQMASMMILNFSKRINAHSDYQMCATDLYLLGFFDYMVAKFGQEDTIKMIQINSKSKGSDSLLKGCANEYGVHNRNVTQLKQMMIRIGPR